MGDENKLKVGQIWKYNTNDNSTVIILKIESRRGVDIVHIAVNGLNSKEFKNIGHLPFDKNTLIESLTEMISEDNILPDFEEGYNQWNEAFENETGGIFTISIKDAVKFIVDIANKGK
ncbi:MAG: hypothetical protein KGV59_01660 [Tenacibaculum sp.]|nr:hypothetical protein [Tenacibaculum sp.]